MFDADGAPTKSRHPRTTGAPRIEVPRGRSSAAHKSAEPSHRTLIEGPRGRATRNSLWLRQIGQLLYIIGATAIAHACFSSIDGARTGGLWLLFSASFQLATAAIGTLAFPNRRHEIIDQVRAYVYGYTITPGVAVAIFMWGARKIALSQPGEGDVFVNTLTSALPWLYFLPVIIPSVIFVKTVAGYRVLNRVQMDDQEMMNVYTRNDGLQR